LADREELQMLKQLKSALQTGGRKGGEKKKRREWADVLVRFLAKKHKRFEDAWNAIPDDIHRPVEITEWDKEYLFYRDGDRVVCVDAVDGKERSLARSTFRRYWQAGQQGA
jgi:hypothetical protein